MRILYFSQNYTTHDRHFLLKLAESEHEILHLMLQNSEIPFENRPLPRNIEQIVLHDGTSKKITVKLLLSCMPILESIVGEFKPDLIHAGPVQSCGFMTAIMDFHPFLIMSWGSDILMDADKDRMHNWMTRYALGRSDMLLCDCNAVKDKVQQLIPYDNNRIVQLPWGIELSEFQNHGDCFDWRTNLGWKNNIIVISTRSWQKHYGINIILKAFHRAYTREPKLRLILAGSGPMEKEIKDYIKNNFLEDIVFLPGRVSNDKMAEYLYSADIYVSSSLSDGSSVSLIEAMAAGLPVIVSDIPGNREWIKPNQNGWLVSPGNFEEFGDSILEVAISSKKKLKQISKINQKIVKDLADWNVNFERVLKAYNKLSNKIKTNIGDGMAKKHYCR